MEGRVFVCSWKRVGEKYRVWVKDRPALVAEADSFEAADEQLYSVILDATGDGENDREYDPPAPVAADLARFLALGLVSVAGNSIAHPEDDGYFDGKRCKRCGHPSGKRTDKPLAVDHIEGGVEGGYAHIRQRPHAWAWRPFFSEAFLGALKPAERSRFEWRKVERPPRAKKVFYELVASRVDVPIVGVRDLPRIQDGWRCRTCGHSGLPHYVKWEWPPHFVCATDLPKPLPSCFTISAGHDFHLCFRPERWKQLVGRAATKGMLSRDVGVVEEERCDREPDVPEIGFFSTLIGASLRRG